MRFTDLFVRGAIVSLHVSLWRARARNIPPDLDIPDTNRVRRALTLGNWRLAEWDEFEKIMTQVRAAETVIRNNSLPFPTIPGARYVPDERLEKLGETLKTLRSRFFEAVDSLIAAYPEIRKKQSEVIRLALIEALGGERVKVDSAHARITSQYPPADEVRRRFDMRFAVYALRSLDRETVAAMTEEGVQVESIVREMVEGLRKPVAEKLAKTMAIIVNGGKLQERTIRSAFAVLDRTEKLNVLGDSTLDAQIKAFRELLKGVTPGEEIKTTVVEGLNDVEKALAEDIEKAMAEAEASLTGVGERKLSPKGESWEPVMG